MPLWACHRPTKPLQWHCWILQQVQRRCAYLHTVVLARLSTTAHLPSKHEARTQTPAASGVVPTLTEAYVCCNTAWGFAFTPSPAQGMCTAFSQSVSPVLSKRATGKTWRRRQHLCSSEAGTNAVHPAGPPLLVWSLLMWTGRRVSCRAKYTIPHDSHGETALPHSYHSGGVCATCPLTWRGCPRRLARSPCRRPPGPSTALSWPSASTQ